MSKSFFADSFSRVDETMLNILHFSVLIRLYRVANQERKIERTNERKFQTVCKKNAAGLGVSRSLVPVTEGKM